MHLPRVTVVALVLSAAILTLAGCSKTTSSTSPTGLDNSPPAPPSHLTGLYDAGQQRDYLIWTGSTSANVSACEVWQYDGNPGAGNSGVLIGSVSVGSTYLVLPTPSQNSVLFYRMRAKTQGGSTSAFTAALPLQRHGAPSPTVEDPGTPDPGVQHR